MKRRTILKAGLLAALTSSAQAQTLPPRSQWQASS